MGSIIKFVIPEILNDKLVGYDLNKIIRAVQSELNAGTVLNSSTKDSQDWKTVKDGDGHERMVMDCRTKAGERMQLENTVGNRFYAWTRALVRLQSFGKTPFEIPQQFIKWLTFAKNP